MKNLSISGSFSTGKSSIVNKLQEEIKGAQFTPDLARVYLNRNNLTSDTLTTKQRQDMQLWVAATYIGAMTQAERSQKLNILDGSLLEVYAYSDGVLTPSQMASLAKWIEKHRASILALVVLPTIPLEKDGVRHTNEEFRISIHQKIMDVIHAFNIEYQFLLGTTVEERANEVKQHIQNYI